MSSIMFYILNNFTIYTHKSGNDAGYIINWSYELYALFNKSKKGQI